MKVMPGSWLIASVLSGGAEAEVELCFGGFAALAHHAFAEGNGGGDVLWFVHHHQGLERGVGVAANNGAGLTGGGVE